MRLPVAALDFDFLSFGAVADGGGLEPDVGAVAPAKAANSSSYTSGASPAAPLSCSKKLDNASYRK